MSKSVFIVFEGIDGSSKTTQVNRTVAYLRSKFGIDQVETTKDLGGSLLGEKLREIMYKVVPPKDMAPGVLDLMFLTGHVQNWKTLVEPWLALGKIVISDRWFPSQFAYGPERGWDERVAKLYSEMKGDWPDLTIFLYGDPHILLGRANARANAGVHQHRKAWNDAEKQVKVGQKYFDLYGKMKGWFPICVDGKSEDQVWTEVQAIVDFATRERPCTS
jgi:dTMP kinase